MLTSVCSLGAGGRRDAARGGDPEVHSSKPKLALMHVCMHAQADRAMPPVVEILKLLRLGIGVHHSGLLPILKELVELLFQEQLIKARRQPQQYSLSRGCSHGYSKRVAHRTHLRLHFSESLARSGYPAGKACSRPLHGAFRTDLLARYLAVLWRRRCCSPRRRLPWASTCPRAPWSSPPCPSESLSLLCSNVQTPDAPVP